MNRSLRKTIVLSFIGLLLVGCQPAPSAPAPATQPPAAPKAEQPAAAAKKEVAPAAKPAAPAKQGGRMVVAAAEEESTLDFHLSNTTIGRTMISNIGDGLVFQDETTELKPGLAESWKQEDPTTWVFQLRRGVKFHDGTPFDAAAVKVNLERLINPDTKSPRRTLYDMIKTIETPDQYTVRLKLAYPYAPLLANLAASNGHFMSPAALQKFGQDIARNPVATGPFVFKEMVSGNRVVLEANQEYWKGRPNLDGVTFTFGTDSPTRVNVLRTGQVHIGLQLSPTDAKAVEGDPNLQVLQLPWPSQISLGMNTQRKPTDDARVRQAIRHAIEVEAIVKNVMLGVGQTQGGIMTPGVFGYNPNLPLYKYDPQKAKELLAQAGYPNGFEADAYFEAGVAQYRQVFEAIQSYLQAVGIRVKIEALDRTALEAKRRSGEFVFIREGWGSTTGDADFFLYPKLHSSSIPPAGSNFTQYSNKKVDELLDQARQESDRAKREKLYQDAEATIHQDSPWMSISQVVEVQGRSKKVKDVLFTSAFTLGFHKAYLD